MKKISLVVPMYNEEEMIPLFFEKMNSVLSLIGNYKFEYVLVNDGSKDRTLELLKEQKKQLVKLLLMFLMQRPLKSKM